MTVKKGCWVLVVVLIGVALIWTACQDKKGASATVPMTLDHNRLIIEAEMQRADGSWRQVRLWIDTGNPDFMMSEPLARDLGVDLTAADTAGSPVPAIEVPAPGGVRIEGMPLDFQGVGSMVFFGPIPLFGTMHVDANLPSTVLKKYQIVFDYPALKLTVAAPGTLPHRGERAPAAIHPQTGIVQLDAVIDGEAFSFALDNGASYSFTSGDIMARLAQGHADWPRTAMALGCANIWGYWPQEPDWPAIRVPEIQWGPVRLLDVGLVGLPNFFAGGLSLGDWYSQKTARRVDGFLGPNAFKPFRIEIDYADSAVYFEPGASFDSHDMDLVGLALRLESDGTYTVIGVAQRDGQPAVAGVQPGDRLVKVDDFAVTGVTMGAAIDALRGKPGDRRTLLLERDGREIRIDAEVHRFL